MHHFTYNQEERQKILPPETILHDIGLQEGMTFVDIGCNDGYFAIPASKIVGRMGKIFAIDIDREALTRLQTQVSENNIVTIQTHEGKAEDTVLCKETADIVFLGTVLHDFSDPLQVLKNAYQMLSDTGRLVNIDWKRIDSPNGPPLEKRFSEATAEKLIKDSGFLTSKTRSLSDLFYMIIAGKR